MFEYVLQDGNEDLIQSSQFSAVKSGYELPPNVAIVTLQVRLDFRFYLEIHFHSLIESIQT